MSIYLKKQKTLYYPLKWRRRCSFLLINLRGLTPVVDGQLLLWIHKGIKESPLLLFSPDDDHTGDDTNHSGGVKEICEWLLRESSEQECTFLCLCVLLLFFIRSLFFVFNFSLFCSFCLLHLVLPPSCEPHNYYLPLSCSGHSIFNGRCQQVVRTLHTLVCN